jgi:hypothetical protein
MVMEELVRLGNHYDIDFGCTNDTSPPVDETYYWQFDTSVRKDAAKMALHYEHIYCLENSIRSLVSSTLETELNTTEWWNTERVSQGIKQEVENRIKRELDEGITRRSNDPLDYTTLGELSPIILENWDIFGGIFNSKKAFSKIMAKLNSLRATIAHCCPLAPDEELRLKLSIRDWFRLME